MYGRHSGRTAAEKEHFYDDLRSEWDLHSMDEIVLGRGDFNGHVEKWIDGYEDVHGGNRLGERNVKGKMLEFCDEKELCVAHMVQKRGQEENDIGTGENELEIDFILVGKGNRKYVRDVKVIPRELQHRLVVVDLVKKKGKEVVRKKAI